MKKTNLLTAALFMLGAVATAQVKIGDNPTIIGTSSALEIESTNKGFVLPRVANTAAIASPVDGMMVFDLSSHCVRVYQNSEWSGCGMISGATTSILQQIGNEGDSPNIVPSIVTVAQLQSLPVTGVNPAYQTYYQNYIDANPNLFSSPATVAEVQAMINAVNVLVQVGNEGDSPDAVNSVVTVAQLNQLPVTGTNPAYETAYQDYIDANPGSFSSPATVQEIQDMINTVNAQQTILQQIGNEGDSPNTVPSVVTIAQLQQLPVTGVNPAYQTYYQDYIDANPALFSAPATVPEVQAMIDVVNSTPNISGLSCSSAVFTPSSIVNGVAYSGTFTLPYTDGNGLAYPAGSGIASTGVTGLTATLQAGTLATGAGSLTYTVTGTPASSGTATFAISIAGQSCNLTKTVVDPVPPSNPAGTGSFSGKTCFDIALGNDNTNSCGPLSVRTLIQADFTLPATHTQNYTFTPIGGPVSNVRFMYINTNGSPVTAISGGNAGNNINTPVVATVNYAASNAPFAGLTNSNPATADIYVIYNDGATNNGTDRQLKLTANIKDCACCMAKINATTYKEFLCHNLGANTSLDPHNMAQTNAWGLNGAYIQWGRRGPNTTGDSRVDWVTAGNTSNFAAAPTGSTANSAAIGGWSASPAPDNSWRTTGGAKTADDPCPAGYRVPTLAEWLGVKDHNTASRSGTPWSTSVTKYNAALHYGPDASTKLLTLPAAGYRDYTNGQLDYRGNYGYYWSSTVNSTYGCALSFGPGYVSTSDSHRIVGKSLRCIAE